MVYRVAGLLTEVKQMVSCRSQLHINVLNTLHDAGVEILSPSAMMQRPLKDGERIVPKASPLPELSKVKEGVPEERIFDKAEEAETVERLVFQREQLSKEKLALEKELGVMGGERKKVAKQRIQYLETEIVRIDAHRDAMSGE